jgi:hypothetical protein
MTFSIKLAGVCLLAAGLCASAAGAEGFRQVTDRGEFLSLVRDRALQISVFGVDLRVSPDGRIAGEGAGRPVTGKWRWNGGYFCRDLAWGERDLGPNCQAVHVSGSTIRFTSDRGEGRSADFRLR